MKSINSWVFGILFFLVTGSSHSAFGQCAGGLLAGTLVPTTSYQYIPCALAGEYYNFAATVGNTYYFTYCSATAPGANYNSINTYLTILDNAGTPVAGVFNDNFCFIGSQITWIATATATFRIRTSLPPVGCGASATCLSLGFKMTPVPGPGVNCGNPMIISALPYTNVGRTTCGNGNTYTSAHACGSTYMNGEDFIFRYVSPGNECINLALTNTLAWVGLFVYNGCPNIGGTTCIAQATSGSGNPSLSSVALTAPGTYYFLVSTLPAPNCTPFDIAITYCPTGNTCANPRVIPSLPYVQNGLTTCGFGNDYNSTHACTDPYMNGEDFVFSYTIPGPRCVDIYTTGTTTWTGLFVMNGCPSTVGTTCVAKNVSIGGNPTLVGVLLPSAGTYYFMVDTKPMPNCTPFNMRVDSCQPVTPCGSNPPAGDLCAGATNISNYTSFCGSTDTLVYNADGPGNLLGTFCGTVENNSWWSFVADTSVVHFFFTVYNCVFGNGIQAQVFSTTNCSTFTSVSTCFNPMSQTNGSLTATGLVVGQTYYLMVDGYAEDDCDYTVSWDGGPLPVKFESINAFEVEGIVHINFQTSEEVGCNGFFVERGSPDLDGETNGFDWENAGYLPAQNLGNTVSSYYLEDDAPLNGDTYYRIREIDYNGFSTYSEILVVKEGLSAANRLLEIYPNPAKDRLNLSMGFANACSANFRLNDISGKVVHNVELGLFSIGNYALSIDLPSLSNGVYIYEMRMGSESSRGKLIIAQ